MVPAGFKVSDDINCNYVGTTFIVEENTGKNGAIVDPYSGEKYLLYTEDEYFEE